MHLDELTVKRFADRYGCTLTGVGEVGPHRSFLLGRADCVQSVLVHQHQESSRMELAMPAWAMRSNLSSGFPRWSGGQKGLYEWLHCPRPQVMLADGNCLFGLVKRKSGQSVRYLLYALPTITSKGEPTVRLAGKNNPTSEANVELRPEHYPMARLWRQGEMLQPVFRDWLVDQGYLEPA